LGRAPRAVPGLGPLLSAGLPPEAPRDGPQEAALGPARGVPESQGVPLPLHCQGAPQRVPLGARLRRTTGLRRPLVGERRAARPRARQREGGVPGGPGGIPPYPIMGARPWLCLGRGAGATAWFSRGEWASAPEGRAELERYVPKHQLQHQQQQRQQQQQQDQKPPGQAGPGQGGEEGRQAGGEQQGGTTQAAPGDAGVHRQQNRRPLGPPQLLAKCCERRPLRLQVHQQGVWSTLVRGGGRGWERGRGEEGQG